MDLTQVGSGGPGTRPEGQKGGWRLPHQLMQESSPLTGQQHGQMAEGSHTEQPREGWRSHGRGRAGRGPGGGLGRARRDAWAASELSAVPLLPELCRFFNGFL